MAPPTMTAEEIVVAMSCLRTAPAAHATKIVTDDSHRADGDEDDEAETVGEPDRCNGHGAQGLDDDLVDEVQQEQNNRLGADQDGDPRYLANRRGGGF